MKELLFILCMYTGFVYGAHNAMSDREKHQECAYELWNRAVRIVDGATDNGISFWQRAHVVQEQEALQKFMKRCPGNLRERALTASLAGPTKDEHKSALTQSLQRRNVFSNNPYDDPIEIRKFAMSQCIAQRILISNPEALFAQEKQLNQEVQKHIQHCIQ